MGVLGSVPATYASPFSAGGPATPIWTWFAGTFLSLTIALSGMSIATEGKCWSCFQLTIRTVAELCSAYPTAGGMYFVTKYVVPPKHVPIAAWIIGWANFLGQTAGVASVAYSVGQMLLAAVSMGSAYDAATDTFAYVPCVPFIHQRRYKSNRPTGLPSTQWVSRLASYFLWAWPARFLRNGCTTSFYGSLLSIVGVSESCM